MGSIQYTTLDCVVVGAGLVGLAVARALALTGREVVVLEAADQIISGTSSRNSGVIHAGLYYPPDSLKARLCLRGKNLLYQYLEDRGLPYRRVGKLVVASSEQQLGRLHELQANARLCGVEDIEWLDAAEAGQQEPALRVEAALYSPTTGILDVHDMGLSLLADLETKGGVFLRHSVVRQLDFRSGIRFQVDNESFQCQILINAAGLGAIELIKGSEGFDPSGLPRQYFAKGHYFSLAGAAPFSRLVYPLPSDSGLGIHFGLDMAGQGRFGPDVCWQNDPSLAFDDGRKADFVTAIRPYWPQLDEDRLKPDFVGVRSKIHGPDEAAADFLLQGPRDHGVPGLVNLFGIESPGLTASLAIGELVSQMPLG
jgi:L-2-hydroxyglutarate oxidase LhgO